MCMCLDIFWDTQAIENFIKCPVICCFDSMVYGELSTEIWNMIVDDTWKEGDDMDKGDGRLGVKMGMWEMNK